MTWFQNWLTTMTIIFVVMGLVYWYQEVWPHVRFTSSHTEIIDFDVANEETKRANAEWRRLHEQHRNP